MTDHDLQVELFRAVRVEELEERRGFSGEMSWLWVLLYASWYSIS